LKKVILGTLALIIALAMIVPATGITMAQTEAAIDVTPIAKRALVVKAPEAARVRQLVTIEVTERYTGRPIAKAGAWAIKVEDVKSETIDAEAYAALVEKCGYFLGWTNEEGNVFHRFREPGRYVLVAVKDGFVPGFTKIDIKPFRALAIRAPEVARAGQAVTIKVFERHAYKPVPRAGVFAVKAKDIVDVAADSNTYAELARERGYFIGLTDGDGEVKHRFREAGQYVLVSVKHGFVPGFAKIAIKPLPTTASTGITVSN